MNDYALLALVWTLTLAVGALAGGLIGYVVGKPGKTEAEERQVEINTAYDLGYRDGYADSGEDTIVERVEFFNT